MLSGHVLVVFVLLHTAAPTTALQLARYSLCKAVLPSRRWGEGSMDAVHHQTTLFKVSALQPNSRGAGTSHLLDQYFRLHPSRMCISPPTPDERVDTVQEYALDEERDRQPGKEADNAGTTITQDTDQGSVDTLLEAAWGNGEIVAGVALFLLLHSIGLSAVQLANPESEGVTFAVAFCRLFSTALFIAVQQRAGLPLADVLTLQADAETAPERANVGFLKGALAPVWGVLLFAAAAFLPTFGQAILEQRSVEDVLMPYARDLPSAGRAFDVVAAAPLTEELFFRGWLLAAMKRRGAPAAASVLLSAASFTLWHASGTTSLGDALDFFGFGAWLALLHMRSNSLLTPILVHCAWNTGFMLLRWQLSLAAL